MKVDIVKDGITCKVFPRLDDEYGEYEGAPIYEADTVWECEEFCDVNMHEARKRNLCALIPAKFIHDVEEKADNYHRQMIEAAHEVGWEFETHITYRASAAWKDEPIHYAYVGDMGSTGYFKGGSEGMANSVRGKIAKDTHNRLCDFSEILWELGLTLTFDKDGKHKVYGNTPKWVTVDDL